ncbi:hypothetical protein JIN84_20855 [Luteolibacter yonseiensis]|uniref:Uncharacterized protein n=1 Tax=Luteolibacter yonseiensis TaxID=1144680 RepID=A0A934R9R0_9BACT|nr:hypothetical protein [Luteolibacter yonseiensis]MBK1818085.1 hypothetical protein [Luteolibacter yonseiensis]
MTTRHPTTGTPGKIIPLLCTFFLGGLAHDSQAQTPPQPIAPAPAIPPPAPAKTDPDAALVISLLGQNLSNRTFSFATVAEACSGKRVLPLTDDAAHKRVTAAIEKALTATFEGSGREDSPVSKLHSADEISKFFEDNIHKHLNGIPGIKCDPPPARGAGHQRPDYPNLRIVDEESKIVFYLDPKPLPQGTADASSLTFHFEPKNETLKINEDAVHLLAGIEHEGKEGAWKFTGWRIVDLSKVKVRLKAEFQATNNDLYQKTELSLPGSSR